MTLANCMNVSIEILPSNRKFVLYMVIYCSYISLFDIIKGIRAKIVNILNMNELKFLFFASSLPSNT